MMNTLFNESKVDYNSFFLIYRVKKLDQEQRKIK